MAHARPFWTFTLQDLSSDTKSAQMWGDLTPAFALWVFGSPGGLQLPTFGSVGFTLTFSPKWGCDKVSRADPLSCWPSSRRWRFFAWPTLRCLFTCKGISKRQSSTATHCAWLDWPYAQGCVWEPLLWSCMHLLNGSVRSYIHDVQLFKTECFFEINTI
jgi:hypothetical protein